MPGQITLRPFDRSDADYARFVEIANANYPDHPYSIEENRHEDQTWNYTRYDRARWMAEDAEGRVIGYCELYHKTSEFDPRRYRIDVYVDPAHQRRGYGSAIYEHVIAELRRRGAAEAQTATDEPRTAVIDFLRHRGFEELRRAWESRLDVAHFGLDAFADAEPRAAASGITFTTLGAEVARDGESALRRAHALHTAVDADVPRVGAFTPSDFGDWVTRVDEPTYLPDGYLIAKRGAEWVAESCLWRNNTFPDVLQQGLTGVVRGHRGTGIAMALKVRGIRFARERGYREIRTFNDTTNQPMLRINETMGFQKQPAWIVFLKRL